MNETKREIKFRYYSQYSDGMLTTDEVTLQEIEDGYFKKPFLSGILYRVQWTGLKDKNSKEIYEGDIIKYKFDKEYVNPVVFKDGSVPTDSPGFMIDTGQKYGHSLTQNSIWAGECEVIGNIYQHSKLLP